MTLSYFMYCRSCLSSRHSLFSGAHLDLLPHPLYALQSLSSCAQKVVYHVSLKCFPLVRRLLIAVKKVSGNALYVMQPNPRLPKPDHALNATPV